MSVHIALFAGVNKTLHTELIAVSPDYDNLGSLKNLQPEKYISEKHLVGVFKFYVGFGGLGVTCLPRDPSFAVSNPAEVVKILSTSPSGGTVSRVSRV